MGNHNDYNHIKWRQIGSGDNEKLNMLTNKKIHKFPPSPSHSTPTPTPLKNEIYDELFKQATVKTNNMSSDSNTLIIKTKKNHKTQKNKNTKNKKTKKQ